MSMMFRYFHAPKCLRCRCRLPRDAAGYDVYYFNRCVYCQQQAFDVVGRGEFVTRTVAELAYPDVGENATEEECELAEDFNPYSAPRQEDASAPLRNTANAPTAIET